MIIRSTCLQNNLTDVSEPRGAQDKWPTQTHDDTTLTDGQPSGRCCLRWQRKQQSQWARAGRRILIRGCFPTGLRWLPPSPLTHRHTGQLSSQTLQPHRPWPLSPRAGHIPLSINSRINPLFLHPHPSDYTCSIIPESLLPHSFPTQSCVFNPSCTLDKWTTEDGHSPA